MTGDGDGMGRRDGDEPSGPIGELTTHPGVSPEARRRREVLVTTGDLPLLQPGTQVDQFKVIRLLGKGGMGEVYLARDTGLGRKVALKVIHAGLIGSEKAEQRFLFEARATARFSHPNIVTIYAVGTHAGSPYVALEYLEGSTFRDRYADERPAPREAARLGLAVAEALAEAHASGILHRDLKPDNVIIPRDGRVRVLDFGLARVLPPKGVEEPRLDTALATEEQVAALDALQTEGRKLAGTPAYMAPEQWCGNPGVDRTDVWALGVMLHELITGHRPYERQEEARATLAWSVSSRDPAPLDPALAEASPELASIVGRCLAKDLDVRPGAREVADALGAFLGRRDRLAAEESPFRGLQPFGERHAEVFFGREPEIAAFLERIRSQPVLPVVGPTGAGKSSLVYAGVVPRLREQGPLSVLAIRPGADPFLSLAARLARGEGTVFENTFGGSSGEHTGTGEGIAHSAPSSGMFRVAGGEGERGGEIARLAHELRETPSRLGLELLQRAEEESTRVLLVVDQLEELFTLTDDPEVQERFLTAVCSAADDPQAPVRVVFTVRDDFLGRLAVGPLVRDVLGRVMVIRNPGPEALEETLTRPLESTPYSFEDPTLPGAMVGEVRGEPAALPLLQFAARTLWDRRDRRRRILLRSAYEAMGGVGGALAEHADSVLQGMTPAQVRLAREVLLRLVRPSRTGGPVTRRVLPAEQVLEGLGDGADEVLDRLTGARLVTVRKRRSGAGGKTDLELVHESLVSGWRQLAQWIDESREELAFLGEAGQAAELWEGRGRRKDEVWSGDALAEAHRVLRRGTAPLPAAVEAFLAASDAAERRALGRKRTLMASGVGVLVVVAVVAVLVALALAEREQEAQDQRAEAEARRAEAQREGARAALGAGNPLEARARLRDSLELEDSLLARSLWAEISSQPLRWTHQLGALANDVALSPDGQTAAVAAGDFSVYVFDVDTMGVRVLRGHRQQVYAVSFSPDGSLLASADMSGEVRLVPLAGGDDRLLAGHADAVNFLAFRPDGGQLATASSDGTVRLWDLWGDRPPTVIEAHVAGVNGVAYAPAGDVLATGGKDGIVKLHDLARGGAVRELEGHTSAATNVAFSPDGSLLASGGLDHTVRLWDVASGAAREVLDDSASRVWDVAFSPDGSRLAAGCWDRMIRVWSMGDLDAPPRILSGHSSGIYGVAFGPTGDVLASAGTDLSLRLWDLRSAPDVRPASGHAAQAMGLAFAADSRSLYSGSLDRSIRSWEVGDGGDRVIVDQLPAGVTALELSPDGRILAAASWDDGKVRLFDPTDPERPLPVLSSGTSWVEDMAFSDDGSALATVAGDRLLRVWDARTWELRSSIQTDQLRIRGVALDPTGSLVAASGDDGTIRLWRVDGEQEQQRLQLEGHGPRGLGFLPDGRGLVSGGINGQVVLWDLDDGRHRILGRFEGRVYFLDVHPDGTHVATSGSDGIARIWDLAGSPPRELRGHRGEVNYASYSPDGAWVATSSDDGTVRVWNTRNGRPAWVAPAMTRDPVRLLTHRGWSDVDGQPVSPGAGSPVWRDALEAAAVRAAFAGTTLCLLTDAGSVELWDTAADRRTVGVAVTALDALDAFPGGCAVLDDGRARVLRASGRVTTLEEEATAVSIDDDAILVGGDGFARVMDVDGTLLDAWEGSGRVEAVGRVAGSLVLGFADGNLEIVRVGEGGLRTTFTFEDVPSTPPTVVREGPMGTLVVGYASGLVGLWNPGNGQRLIAERLHGPVAHVALDGARLVAASELGDQRTIDLAVFQRSYCDLLREVWADVPVVWRDGLPVPAEPDPTHVCASGS